MEYFGYILLSIVILLLMVMIHEFGHYTFAKLFGFTIEEFSVGFGPKIFSHRRKNGELFSVRMLPLGGYCAFLNENGEDETAEKPEQDADIPQEEYKTSVVPEEKSEEEDLLSYVMRTQPPESKTEPEKEEDRPIRLDKDGNRARTYSEEKPWKRMIVLLGGVLFNFISAILFSLIYIGAVGFAAPSVATVYANGDKPYCELLPGDIILAVNGEEVSVMRNFNEIASGYSAGDTVVMTVDRAGEVIDISVAKQRITVTDEEGKKTEYDGFGFTSQSVFIGNDAKNAFTYCVPYTFKLSWAILGSFGDMITGKVPVTSMSGPIGSVNLMAQLSVADWRNILILLPLLASNLAIFNLLPIPALDGARLVFTAIEWVRGKPVNKKVEETIHFVGMVALLLFVLVVDILSFVL